MALTQNNLNDILNNKGSVLSSSGDKIGSVDQFYVDDASGQIAWVSVSAGLFGTSESYIPLDNATVQGNDVVVPYTKDQVKDAPKVNKDGGALEEDDQDVLYRHYGIGGSTGFAGTGATGGYSDTGATGGYTDTGVTGGYTDTADTTVGTGAAGRDADYVGSDAGTGTGLGTDSGHDTSGPNTDDAMTRSEEQVNVGTRQTETGRARLRKYIVTENVTTTVPVSREEVRIEREPITEANVGAAMSGGDLTEEEHEVTLHAERPVVEKETVPVERVRLDKDVVTDTETVTTDARKEEIDIDVDGDGRPGTTGTGAGTV
jgi:uncharacterized protein (TIGR02271 family)